MKDWQIAVLNSEDIRVDQDRCTGYRLIIRSTTREHRMGIPEIVATIKNTRRKPVIMRPEDPFRGMFADRKEVLDVLMSTSEYQEHLLRMAEAKMNGAI